MSPSAAIAVRLWGPEIPEFIVISSTDPSKAERIAALDGSALSRRRELDHDPVVSRKGSRLVLTVGSHGDGQVFDGSAVISLNGGCETFISRGMEFPKGAIPTGRGNYVFLSTDDDGGIRIETDQLGTYPVFHAEADGFSAISNNAHFIVDAFSQLGVRIERDLSIYGYFIALGAAIDGLTGYAGIRRLPPASAYILPRNNKARIETRPMPQLLYSNRKYADLLEQSFEEIRTNVRVVAESRIPILISDLSGGMDSRIVLAAILHEKLEERFHFFTANEYPNADANTAALVRNTFGLRRVDALAQEPVNASPFERLQRTVGRLWGLMETCPLVPPTARRDEPPTHMRLGGGFGEIMRSYWGGPRSLDGASPMERQLKTMRSRSGLLASEVAEAQRGAVADQAERLLSQGLRRQDVPDAMYLLARIPYHFGVFWRASRTRFHPLYSPSALQAAHALADEQRRANRLGHDLMTRFCPKLAALPFAEKSWDPIVTSGAAKPITTLSPSHFAPDERPVRIFEQVEASRQASQLEEALKAQGARASALRIFDLIDDFRLRCPSPELDAMAPVFDPGKLRRFLLREREAFGNQKRVNATRRVLVAYIWANALDTTAADWRG